MSYTAHKLLVTGGAGFIGSHFIIYLLNTHPDMTVINLDKLTYASNLSYLDSIHHHKNYHFLKGDIADTQLINKILKDYTVDTIVNFAAESHVDRSIENPSIFIQNNIVGTHHLLQSAYQYWKQKFNLDPLRCRFHQISTDEVYGSLNIDAPAFNENSPYQPNSPYSASKAAADHLVQAYYQTYRLPMTISNCSNNYGAHQHTEKLIPKIIHCCLEELPIPIYNDGSNIRDWIFVDDHCHAIDLILRKGKVGQRYNVGGNEEISNLTLTQWICHEIDKIVSHHAPHERLIKFVVDRPGHDFRYALNSTLLKSTTGWQPKTRLKNALYDLIQLKMLNYV